MKSLGAGVLVVVTAALMACDRSTNSGPTSPSTSGSTLNVVLTDTPFSDARAVFVKFSAINVHVSGGAFQPLPFVDGAASRTCDLKKLTGAQDVLGTGVLTPGHYTQIRLDIDSAVIYLDNASSGSPCATSILVPSGRSAPVTIPSSEIILNREFDVTASGPTTITLDFNGDQSITQTGNGAYMMSPVISIVSVQ